MPKEDNALTRLVYNYVNGKISDKELIESIKGLSDKYPYAPKSKKFDLEKAKQGKPVCTRDGRKARIVCFDAKFPKTGNIIALVEKENGEEIILYYYDNGRCSIGSGYDLIMTSEKHEMWMNVYEELCYKTKEEAIRNIAMGTHYIDTIKVEWEE